MPLRDSAGINSLRQQVYCCSTIRPHPFDDRSKLFCGRQAINRALNHFAFDLLFNPRHADLEEFVEVRTDNAEELHPLQQRVSA